MVKNILERNRKWAESRRQQEPGYFPRLAAQQRPEYFWIGCSDSRVPANVVAGLDPGEVFVHRNVANVVHSADLNMLSSLEYAVLALEIKKIIVCGHYGCGGVKAAAAGLNDLMADNWIEPIRVLKRQHMKELEGLNEDARDDRLAELNVMASVNAVCRTPILQNAWADGTPIVVHGLIYGLKDGVLRDLGCSVSLENWEQIRDGKSAI